MRTQLVPTWASAKGSNASEMAMGIPPANTRRRRWRQSSTLAAPRAAGPSPSRSHPAALTEQAGGPEHQHQDQHDEGEYVLIVRAKKNEVAAALAIGDALGQRLGGAEVGEIADVAGAERLDDAEQHAAEHRARDVADAAEHGG